MRKAKLRGFGLFWSILMLLQSSCKGQELTVSTAGATPTTTPQPTTTTTLTTIISKAPDTASKRKFEIPQDNFSELTSLACYDNESCRSIDNSYCDIEVNRCRCKPDYPITDSKHCYKESKLEEFCFMDVQCQRKDKNSRCNRDFSVCECMPRFAPKPFSKSQTYLCMEATVVTDMSVGSYVNPTLFGIMGGLALMFIVMCVVLRLFAKAQFTDNRTIFNTPNPRLMNVSLLKESKLFSTQSRKTTSRSASRSTRRVSSIAAAAAAAAAVNEQLAEEAVIPETVEEEETAAVLNERGQSGTSHDEGSREHRKRSAAGRAGGGTRQSASGGEVAVATADIEDNQSMKEIKDSAA